MLLTASQKAKIKKILTQHQRDVRGLVKKYKTTVVNAVTKFDKKKVEEIRKRIR